MGLRLSFTNRAKNIARCNEGVAFIEFALCAPFLIAVFFGTVEVARYFLAVQKVEKTIDLVTDTVTQADQSSSTEKITPASMSSLLATIPSMMSPYEVNPPAGASRGIVYLTDVKQPADITQPAVINWQACGGGTLAHASAIGSASGDPTNPATADLGSFTMLPGEEVVIGEIYYEFSPILLQDIIGDISMSRTVYFVPRFGDLTAVPVTCP